MDAVNSSPGQPPETTFLKDYSEPSYWIRHVDLEFELDERKTFVTANLHLEKNKSHNESNTLCLDGHSLELLEIKLNGKTLPDDNYTVSDDTLELSDLPDKCVLTTKCAIYPGQNTALEGLYHSGSMLCTQCEAEGFRRITYFLDRPDVMTSFKVKLIGDKKEYPLLLSNGNPVDQGELPDNKHWAVWEDPFPKPSYLFALVAGNLFLAEDSFTTISGREISLRLYVEHQNSHKTEHALRSLKEAMQWDEQRFGREYDLDIYMIVAVDDFNMGAMENKGLNVFNSSCVLASPETATDADYYNIQSIVGHEYFHNWSGNRVTCRDWFQLSLKEGFTVFRDQEFSADLNSRGVKRIEDVNVLRNFQFAEDAGPMSHPVRPDSYIEISNFYTVTVYNKGAEVVRMLHTLTGESAFRKGTDLYFSRFDGQAVTTDDFVNCIAESANIDLTQFRRWYYQSGTPVISVSEKYDTSSQTYSITLEQTCPPTPGQEEKQPFHIPVRFALLDSEGKQLDITDPHDGRVKNELVLNLSKRSETYSFDGISSKLVASLLRGFSAPVKLDWKRTVSQLAFLMAHETDQFNRWDASQELYITVIRNLIEAQKNAKPLRADKTLLNAVEKVLDDNSLDHAFKAQLLTLPGEQYIGDQQLPVDVDEIHIARQYLCKLIGQNFHDKWLALYTNLNDDDQEYVFNADYMGARSLKNTALFYLGETGSAEGINFLVNQCTKKHNMTDVMAALNILKNIDTPERETLLNEFYREWESDPQVIDKWFAIQATSTLPDTLEKVIALQEHPAFSIKNPNKVRSLISRFCSANPVNFHRKDGTGYCFLADAVIRLDKLNPQIAARILTPLTRWKNYDKDRQEHMKAALNDIKQQQLSKDVFEVVSKSLK